MLTKSQMQNIIQEKCPERVRFLIKVVVNEKDGYCKIESYKATIYKMEREYNEFGFYHELGHAVAFLMDLNKELGNLVMNNQNGLPTNDNPFSYGVQVLEMISLPQRKNISKMEVALQEFSADAIAYYYMDMWEDLPEVVLEYLKEKLTV